MLELDIRRLLECTKDERQLRLFAVACCRNVWHLLTDQRSKDTVEVAESFADGLVSEEELSTAMVAAWNAEMDAARDGRSVASSATSAATCVARAAANYAGSAAANGAAWAAGNNIGRIAVREQQLVFLQDIINQPSIELNPSLFSWNNSILPKFATNIYTNKDFSLMPILADALEEANAPDTFIEHARERIHVKGCWLLDVLMGKR